LNKGSEELYEERIRRFDDALQLKIPGRVPFIPHTHFFAARYSGVTPEEAFYRAHKWIAAGKRMIFV
jgi:hypothetical protein